MSLVTEALVGLSQPVKALPPKLLYDERGSEIFEQICSLKEYYPTRAEKEILETHASEISSLMGERVLLVEPGAGNCEKVSSLLSHLHSPLAYIPLEISQEILYKAARRLQDEFPAVLIHPLCADFTQNLRLPKLAQRPAKRVVFFPGSTIGNFTPEEAVLFLKKVSLLTGKNGGLLVGVDLKKDPRLLNLAYDDPHGVTAAFNLNLLERLNREARASFDLSCFEHHAYYNEELGRVEMHLRSKRDHSVRVHESIFRFHKGESIHTENSYKYSEAEFVDLASKAQFSCRRYWKDKEGLFCVYYFEKK